ncbi:hypothetical protein QQF64_034405, partial [Cirrhinus molitorella]
SSEGEANHPVQCQAKTDMMKPSGWLLSIEGHVVMGPHPFFLHGVAAFFSSYYIFNLEYPATGSSTLEFIQSFALQISLGFYTCYADKYLPVQSQLFILFWGRL